MRYTLRILEAALILILTCESVAFRILWRNMRAHQAAVLSEKVPVVPATPSPAVIPPGPVAPTSYTEIVSRDLFDPSRTPDLVMELPPQPPPPVMPPLPRCFGVLNFGDGAAAIVAETDHSAHQLLHTGATIGQFKLIDVDTDAIVLEWNGRRIHQSLAEVDSASPQQLPTHTDSSGLTPPLPFVVRAGTEEDKQRRFTHCSMSDGLAEGTELEGYRKKVLITPLGPVCRWLPQVDLGGSLLQPK